jgi:hypothetical protein
LTPEPAALSDAAKATNGLVRYQPALPSGFFGPMKKRELGRVVSTFMLFESAVSDLLPNRSLTVAVKLWTPSSGIADAVSPAAQFVAVAPLVELEPAWADPHANSPSSTNRLIGVLVKPLDGFGSDAKTETLGFVEYHPFFALPTLTTTTTGLFGFTVSTNHVTAAV